MFTHGPDWPASVLPIEQEQRFAVGTFRTLNASLQCKRCGLMHRAAIQFKTGDDYAMPEYEVGDVVDDVAPDEFDGIADAYCGSCRSHWVEDEKRVQFALLADDVAAGRITARKATWRHGALDGRPELGLVLTLLDSEPMTASDVLALAQRPEGFGWPSFPARLSEADVALWQGNARLHPHDDRHDAAWWWIRRNNEVVARLTAIGWLEEPDPWIEVPVLIDQDHRIRLASA